jgi:hypothetical protein
MLRAVREVHDNVIALGYNHEEIDGRVEANGIRV